MAYHLKRDYLRNWDLQQINEKPMINDDDQDTYISERSSLISSNDASQTKSPVIKRLPAPTPSLPSKTPHTLRYPYNELPETGIPAAIQFQMQRKQDKKTKFRKAPAGQGSLVPLPETKPPELADNYYPYWYYYKVTNPDWIMRQRRTADGQIIPYDSFDPSRYAPAPAIETSSIKPKKRVRKSHHNDVSRTQSKQDKQRLDHTEKNSSISPHLIFYEDQDHNSQQQRPSQKQYIPLNDVDNDEHRDRQTKRKISQQHRKLKTENEWTEHYMQSLSGNRPKNQLKIPDNHPLTSDLDANSKHHHHHHHNQTHSHNHPSITSQQNHHHHHQTESHSRHSPFTVFQQNHHHHHQNQTHPSSVPSEQNHHHHHHYRQQNQTHLYNPSIPSQHNHDHSRHHRSVGAHRHPDVQIVNVLFEESARPPYYKPTRDDYHLPALSHYKPTHTHYLPPIILSHHHLHKTPITRFPSEYYGTLARQTNDKNWKESIGKTKIYKPDQHTRFYDHHSYHVVDKGLAV